MTAETLGRAGRGRSGPFRVVIAGGGIAAVEAVLALRTLAGERVSLTMISPDEHLLVRPLSVAEPFEGPQVRRYPLDRICSDMEAELVHDALRLVDDRVGCVFTKRDRRLSYDALVIAVGAPRRPVLEHACTFTGEEHAEEMRGLLQDVELGHKRRIAFVAPARAGWTLPLYELVLQTAHRAHSIGVAPQLTLVTAEAEPLEAFRGPASQAVSGLLRHAGVKVITGVAASSYDGSLLTSRDRRETLVADAVVALPAQYGPIIHGLRSDIHNFLPVDGLGRVEGRTAVYAAGDATDYLVKAGGVATQHAATVATTIAASIGVPVTPRPFRPVLRAKLLTGERPLYLRANLVAGMTTNSETFVECPFDADEKLYGAYLTPYLASRIEQLEVAS